MKPAVEVLKHEEIIHFIHFALRAKLQQSPFSLKTFTPSSILHPGTCIKP